jgi:hypothetical protein
VPKFIYTTSAEGREDPEPLPTDGVARRSTMSSRAVGLPGQVPGGAPEVLPQSACSVDETRM